MSAMAARFSLLILTTTTCVGALRRHSKSKKSMKKNATEFSYGGYGDNHCEGDLYRVEDEAACREAASGFGLMFVRSVAEAGIPKGCIAHGSMFVLLNTASDGLTQGDSKYRPICYKKEKEAPKAPEPFALGPYGENACSGDWQRIDDEAQCRVAVEALGLTFAVSNEEEGAPKGCHTNSLKHVYFNSVSEEKSRAMSRYRPVCFSTAVPTPAPAPDPSSVTWILGQAGTGSFSDTASTCTETCSRKGMKCSAAEMDKVISADAFVKAIHGLGIRSQCKELAAVRWGPTYFAPHILSRTGECTYLNQSKNEHSECDGRTYMGYQRLCACQA